MSGGKSGGAQRALDYFGTIAGVACCGPADFISGVVVDNALVWPDAVVWPASRTFVHSRRMGCDGVHVGIQCDQPHGLSQGDSFTTWGFDAADARLNIALGTVTGVNDAWGFQFAAPPGVGAFGVIDFGDGFVSRVQPFTAGPPPSLVRIGPTVYTCIASHQASAANMPGTPGGVAFWRPFRLPLAVNPTLEAEPGAPDGAGAYPVVQLTTESHGEIFIYRGSADQRLDTLLEKTLARYGHPAYRDQVVVVLKRFFFGRESATAPNVSVILGRTPQQSVITGPAAALDSDGQANPLCVLAELLTHPIWGLGLDPAMLDAASWQATADWLLASSAAFYISPLIDQPRAVRDLAADLLDHCDGWLRWTPDGRIEAGHRLHNQPPPAFEPGRDLIDVSDAIDGRDLDWTTGVWDDTANKVTLHYADRDHGWRTRPAIASASWNRAASGRIREQVVEAPHVCRLSQALVLAAWRAKVGSEPGVSGVFEVRAERVAARPGDPVLAVQAATGSGLPMMVTERTWRALPGGRLEVRAESIRGLSAEPVAPLPGASLGTPRPDPAPVSDNYTAPGTAAAGPPAPNDPPTPNYAFLQLPPVLWGGRDFELTLLAGRTSAVTRAYDVHYRFRDAGAFKPLFRVTTFAVAGWLVAPLPLFTDVSGNPVQVDDTHPLRFAVHPLTPPSDLDHVAAPPTADDVADNALLAVIVRNGAPHVFELCSVKGLTAEGGGVHSAALVRGVHDTPQGGDGATPWAGSPSGGDLVFLIHKNELSAVTTDGLAGVAQAGATIALRIAPESAWFAADPGDVYDPVANPSGLARETTYAWGDLFAPTASGWAVSADGNAYNGVAGYTTATVFSATFTAAAGHPSAALASVQLTAWGGGVAVPLLLTTDVAGAAATRLTTRAFSLPASGDWYLQATIRDDHGRVGTAVFPDASSRISIPAAPAGPPNPPTATPPGVAFFWAANSFPVDVTLSCSTPGALCEYSVTALGAPAGAWIQGAAVRMPANRTLHARSFTPGPIRSAEVSWDFRNRG
jgi:Putative phage tail protein